MTLAAQSSLPDSMAYQLCPEGQLLGLWQGFNLIGSEGAQVSVPAGYSRVSEGGWRCCELPRQSWVLLAGHVPTHVAVLTEVLLQGIKIWGFTLCLGLLLTLLS